MFPKQNQQTASFGYGLTPDIPNHQYQACFQPLGIPLGFPQLQPPNNIHEYQTFNQGNAPHYSKTKNHNTSAPSTITNLGHTQIAYSSSSENENLDTENNKHSWQQVRKRKRLHKPSSQQQSNASNTQTPTKNRYLALDTHEENENTNHTQETQKIPKPPPIFIYGVKDFKKMINNLAEVTADETYHTKALANEIVKINAHTIDTYRKLVRHLRDENIIHHTYQVKEERAYRVVIRNLHHSVPLEDIKQDLSKAGHNVRNIVNIKHRVTKEPLCMFFIDLEPTPNNKPIFHQEFVSNTKITVEPPRKQRGLVQ